MSAEGEQIAWMHLLGVPLVKSQQEQTPMQASFLAVALPRVEMMRQGGDPENPSGKKSKPRPGETELTRRARERREGKSR